MRAHPGKHGRPSGERRRQHANNKHTGNSTRSCLRNTHPMLGVLAHGKPTKTMPNHTGQATSCVCAVTLLHDGFKGLIRIVMRTVTRTKTCTRLLCGAADRQHDTPAGIPSAKLLGLNLEHTRGPSFVNSQAAGTACQTPPVSTHTLAPTFREERYLHPSLQTVDTYTATPTQWPPSRIPITFHNQPQTTISPRPKCQSPQTPGRDAGGSRLNIQINASLPTLPPPACP